MCGPLNDLPDDVKCNIDTCPDDAMLYSKWYIYVASAFVVISLKMASEIESDVGDS